MNKIAIITVLLTMIYCKSFTQEWHTGMLPEPAWVFDFLKYNDKLYFTGSFPSVDVDTVTLNSIAYWDSLTMHPLGFGITSIGGAAWSLEEFADCIIVGGSFIEAGGVQNTNRLAKFDGQNWSPVGDSGYPDGEVRAMKNFNGELYIGGGFGHIGSILLWGVGKFDGTNWINIGSSGCSIYAMDIYNNDLYLGGSFTSMGGTFADGLVRNDGSGWQAVGGGVNGYILDMVVDSINNFLYVAGAFSTIDDTIYANDLAVWDGYEWNNFDFSTNNEISEIEIYRGDVYIGGFFTQFGDINDTICIGRWNGIEWDTLPGRLWSTVQALEVYKDELYVGGYLYEVNGDTCYALARWYMPPGYNCNMLEPRVYCAADTFYMQLGEAAVQFHNNNAYSPYWQWDFGDGSYDSVQNPVHTFSDTGQFEVCVTVAHEACVKTGCKTITVLNPTGMEEKILSRKCFCIFPNPVDNRFTADISIPTDEVILLEPKLVVFDINGLQKATYKLAQGENKVVIDCTGWPPGSYVCSFYYGDNILISKKIVIE